LELELISLSLLIKYFYVLKTRCRLNLNSSISIAFEQISILFISFINILYNINHHKIRWVEVHHHSVNATPKPILFAEDAEECHTISRKVPAQLVDIPLPDSESTDGHSRPNKEKELELEEWDTLRLSPESTKIKSKAEIDYLTFEYHSSITRLSPIHIILHQITLITNSSCTSHHQIPT